MGTVFGDAKMTSVLLDRLTYRCQFLETGEDNIRFKGNSVSAARKNGKIIMP